MRNISHLSGTRQQLQLCYVILCSHHQRVSFVVACQAEREMTVLKHWSMEREFDVNTLQ